MLTLCWSHSLKVTGYHPSYRCKDVSSPDRFRIQVQLGLAQVGQSPIGDLAKFKTHRCLWNRAKDWSKRGWLGHGRCKS